MKQFFILLLFVIGFQYVNAQTDIDYVEKQYPEVFSDIYNRAVLQSGETVQQERIIQEQVYAFLDLAEDMNRIDNAAMAESILRWSTKGYEDYNQTTLEDSTIENPFAQLRCDWVLARLHYKRILSGIDKSERNQQGNPKAVSANYNRDQNYRRHYSTEYLELLKKRYKDVDTEVEF